MPAFLSGYVMHSYKNTFIFLSFQETAFKIFVKRRCIVDLIYKFAVGKSQQEP